MINDNLIKNLCYLSSLRSEDYPTAFSNMNTESLKQLKNYLENTHWLEDFSKKYLEQELLFRLENERDEKINKIFND